MAMANGSVGNTGSAATPTDDPNLIKIYGVGEFDLYVEASPLAAAELVAELHKRGVAVKQLAPTGAPEIEQ